VTVQKRSLKAEKLARIYDDEIAPVWGTRFGRMLLRNLSVPARGQVLDVSCGTGYPLTEILRRMGEGSRVIAIDASSAMLDVARKKVADLGPLGKKGVFFRTESPLPKLSFTDDVYDLVVCNLGLAEMPDVRGAIRDFARVTKVGGEVRCTLPLAGSFQEFHDIYREVLVKHDKHDAQARLDAYLARYPTIEQVNDWMAEAGLDGEVQVETFTLLFRSSREFFFAPVIEYGPLADWKALAGNGQELQDVFWYIKEAIDAYFGGRAFEVTVTAGCIVGSKASEPRPALEVDDVATGRLEMVDAEDLDELLLPHALASGSARTRTPGPTRTSSTPGFARGGTAAVVERSADTSEIDIVEIEEVTSTTGEIAGDGLGEGMGETVGLDAFTDGVSRPEHLDD
jgi:ubiquinone/menaquinone biosynthesis C-methylase UbiE